MNFFLQEPSKSNQSFIDVESYRCKKRQNVPKQWIPQLHLNYYDKKVLTSPKGWLNDQLIDGAQKLLIMANSAIPGLQEICRARICDFDIQTGEFLQVLHDGSDHWLTVSNVGIKSPAIVKVYDSKYTSASPDLKMQIASLLHTEHPEIQLQYPKVQKQIGGSDCGLFAVAFATAIVFGIKPEQCVFNQQVMRSHLVRCFEERTISMFPMKLNRHCRTLKMNFDSIKVFCQCRMPEFSSSKWIQCSSCHEWFHVFMYQNSFSKEI